MQVYIRVLIAVFINRLKKEIFTSNIQDQTNK